MSFTRPHALGILVSVTGVSFVALIGLGWRSLNTFEAAVARVLQEACASSARDAAQQIQRDLRSPVFNLLEQVDHSAIKNSRLETIAETLRERAQRFPMIDTFFVWTVAPDHKGSDPRPESSALFYSFSSPRDAGLARAHAGNVPAGFFSDPALSSVLQQQALKLFTTRRNFALMYLQFDNRAYHVVYNFVYDDDERRTLRGVEGFLADLQHVRDTYFSEFVASWTRQRNGQRAGSPVLAVSIFDDDGREVSRSGRSLLHKYEAEAPFPLVFFDTDLLDTMATSGSQPRYWSVRTGYQAGDIAVIVRQEGQLQRGAWLLVAVIAAIGIISVAWATNREIRLAQMQSEFVASVSHALKTPLAKIQLFAETLESGRVSSPDRAMLYQRRIGIQARKLGQLIGALLDFNKFEAGAGRYPLEEVDLRSVLRSAIEPFEDELAQDGYHTDIVLPDEQVSVLANGEALQQLFRNLIGNAIKYSPGERFLRIAVSTADGYAFTEVTDHGIGIPRREQPKIFRKFYRGGGAVAMAISGSGIGLAIVNHVARVHNGRVSVTSVPGQGTTFKVRLRIIAESPAVQG